MIMPPFVGAWTHGDLSQHLVRPPGTPPSACCGVLHRVDASGARIADGAPPYLDDCQAGEGEIGQGAAVELWRCQRCRSTLVVATCPDGTRRSRNDYGGEDVHFFGITGVHPVAAGA